MQHAYTQKVHGLLKSNTPLVFADGTHIYKQIAEHHITHKSGFFILAPSGAGKTHYIQNQKEPHWIDGDEIWMRTNAHPDGPWWLEDISVIDEIDQRSDCITVEAKRLGFWIMGSSNFWLKPDAVVIPDWETHKKYIALREETNYDGGATSKDLERLKKSREWMSRWAKDGVTIYPSIEEAVSSLTSGLK